MTRNEKSPAGGTARALKNDLTEITCRCNALTRDPQALCVHFCDRHIGFVVETKCGGHFAVSVRSGALGRFNSESAAATAVILDLTGARDGR